MVRGMSKAISFLFVLAACGGSLPYHCTATVTGTGTSADGTYTCQIPPNATYTTSSQAGAVSGNFFSNSGPQLVFSVSTVDVPKPRIYSDDTLVSGESYSVMLVSAGKPLWKAETGSHAFSLEVTKMDGYGKNPLIQTWSVLAGSLNATLTPDPDNTAATTDAKVTLTFY